MSVLSDICFICRSKKYENGSCWWYGGKYMMWNFTAVVPGKSLNWQQFVECKAYRSARTSVFFESANQCPRKMSELNIQFISIQFNSSFINKSFINKFLLGCDLRTFKLRCLKGCFYGAHERFAKNANVKKLHSHFRLQKFAKPARGFRSVINCSWESFLVCREFPKSLKFFANISRILGRDLLVICSRKCQKSFVIYMCMTYSRRAWCSQNLCETPSRFRQFGECLAKATKFVW